MSLEANPAFVHLRVHSEFSIVNSTIRIDDLIAAAADDAQPAVALTDINNLFAAVKFFKAARKKGLKPILGADLRITNPQDRDHPHQLLVLVQNQAGYHNLCCLISKAYLENQYRGLAEVCRDWLPDHAEGLIALSGARGGEIGCCLLSGHPETAVEAAVFYQRCFPGRFYLEVQRSDVPEDERVLQRSLELSQRLALPVVATSAIQFLLPEDFRAHEARVCIAEGETLANPRRNKRYGTDQHFMTRQQMQVRFADLPQALAQSVEIAKRCNVELSLGKALLPDFPTPAPYTINDYLTHLAQTGLDKRLVLAPPDESRAGRGLQDYQDRLLLECRMIVSMGFAGYFLIVQDFINWAKQNGVPVGPGRGSGAGSLAAYCLGITDIDPLQYDLLFERFLNPERVSMPDFDIDFCQDNRDRVIDYVKLRYGRDAVAQIATFGTLGAKAVIRDVGRVLDLPYMLCDGLAKLIPHVPTDPWDLQRALTSEPSFKERYEQEEEARALIDLALPLEGLTRNVGMHAGGVLIAPGKLTDFCPLFCQPGQTDAAVSQFDKDDVEAIGLVKFDFLGLRNLTILDWAVRYVRQFNPDRDTFDLNTLVLNDTATYRLLSDANTTAIFQLESRGMKELLKKLQPTNFEDIIAVLALYRPGPLGSGMVDDFVNRKHGRAKAEYFHADLEAVLKPTYGVIVYQEQVMLISQIIGGYSLGGADLLRRAMGKKKAEEMATHREIFQGGAERKGYSLELGVTLFNLMEKFAEYGFNKSHTAAYALIAYQTAWLKAHHPAEFAAATLSSDMDDTDKVQIFYQDALANQLTVLPPDVNSACFRFIPVQDEHSAAGKPPRTLRYGLGAIKGTGEAAVEAIEQARQLKGPFVDLFDFCARIDRSLVNRRAIDALIKAGAFDGIVEHRAQALADVAVAMDAAEQAARAVHQNSLFGDIPLASPVSLQASVPEWTKRNLLAMEKTALGFYFSGHLFNGYVNEVRRFVPRSLAMIAPSRDLQRLAGIISSIRTQMTRRGKMLFVSLDDGTAVVEVAVFNELFERHRSILREDQLLIIQAKVSHDEYSGGQRINAEEVFDIDGARQRFARNVRLEIGPGFNISYLKQLLEPLRVTDVSLQQGAMPRAANKPVPAKAGGTTRLPAPVPLLGVAVQLAYRVANLCCTLRLGEQWRIRVPDELAEQLERQPGVNKFQLIYD